MLLDPDAIVVSVICETFNHGRFVRDTLDGFLVQKTDFRFEVIVHDDASTDDTPDIIREYHDLRPDLFQPILQTENQWSMGVDTSTSFILPRARGQFLAYCEGDDYWTDPFKLQKQVDFFRAHPKVGLVHTEMTSNASHEDIFTPWALAFRRSPVRFAHLPDLLCGNFISTPTSMVRKEAMTTAIDDSARYPNKDLIDLWFWMRIAWDWDIAFLPEPTAYYRVHSSGMSRNAPFMNLARIRILNFHLRHGLSRRMLRGVNPEQMALLAERFREQVTAKDLGLEDRIAAFVGMLSNLPPSLTLPLLTRWVSNRRRKT